MKKRKLGKSDLEVSDELGLDALLRFQCAVQHLDRLASSTQQDQQVRPLQTCGGHAVPAPVMRGERLGFDGAA